MTRMHKYTFTVDLYTTDGYRSPDDFAQAIEQLPFGQQYAHVDATLQDRATCPQSRDVDAPPVPEWPADERQRAQYYNRLDERRDALTQAVYQWRNGK